MIHIRDSEKTSAKLYVNNHSKILSVDTIRATPEGLMVEESHATLWRLEGS